MVLIIIIIIIYIQPDNSDFFRISYISELKGKFKKRHNGMT